MSPSLPGDFSSSLFLRVTYKLGKYKPIISAYFPPWVMTTCTGCAFFTESLAGNGKFFFHYARKELTLFCYFLNFGTFQIFVFTFRLLTNAYPYLRMHLEYLHFHICILNICVCISLFEYAFPSLAMHFLISIFSFSYAFRTLCMHFLICVFLIVSYAFPYLLTCFIRVSSLSFLVYCFLFA